MSRIAVAVFVGSAAFADVSSSPAAPQTGDEILDDLANRLKNPNKNDTERAEAARALMTTHGASGWQRLAALLAEVASIEAGPREFPRGFAGALKAIGAGLDSLSAENDAPAIALLEPLLDLRVRPDAPREVDVLLRALGARESLWGEVRRRVDEYLASSEPQARARGLQAVESLWIVSLAQNLARIAYDAEALDPAYRMQARASMRRLVGRSFDSRREFDDWFAVHQFSPREEILTLVLQAQFERERQRILTWVAALRVEDLLGLLGDREDPQVRRGAAAELAQRVAATAAREPEFVQQVVGVLADRSQHEIAVDVRVELVRALAGLAAKIKENPTARERLRAALLDRSRANGTTDRLEATLAIGGLESFPNDSQVLTRVLELVVSLSGEVETTPAAREYRRKVVQVARALEFGAEFPKDRLLEALEVIARRDEYEGVRGAAVDALAKHGGAAAFDTLAELFHGDPSVIVRNKALMAVDELATEAATRQALVSVWMRGLQSEGEAQIRQSICERLFSRMEDESWQALIGPDVYRPIGERLAGEQRVELRRWMSIILTHYIDESGLRIAFRHLSPPELTEAARRLKQAIEKRPEPDRPHLLVRVGQHLARHGPALALRDFLEPALGAGTETNGGSLRQDTLRATVIARWYLHARLESLEVFPPAEAPERLAACRQALAFLKEIPANPREPELQLAEIDLLLAVGEVETARERLQLAALAKPEAVSTNGYAPRLERAATLEYALAIAQGQDAFANVKPWVDQRLALAASSEPATANAPPCYPFRRIAFHVWLQGQKVDWKKDDLEVQLRYLLEGRREKGARVVQVDEGFVRRALEVSRLLDESMRQVLADYLGALELPATLPDALKTAVAALRGS